MQIAMLLAGLPATDAARTVTVIGAGEARARPDRARVTVGVETQAKSAEQALAANSRKVESLLAAVRSLGIEKEHIQTTHLALHPVYSSPREGTDMKLVGYRAENHVSLTTDDVASLGRLLDGLVEAGANRILALGFEISKPEALMGQARARAMAQAERAARDLASLAGLELGQVVSIREAGARLPGPVPMAMEARSDVPIEPGTEEVSFTVEVTFALEPKKSDRAS